MSRQPHRRRAGVLWFLVLLAAAFNIAVWVHPALTGNDNVNGLGGVFLGLFIASFPAANFLDMILFEEMMQRWKNLKHEDIRWVLLNLFVLLVGLIVVVVGTKLFFKNWKF
jgi:hypothetical protein